MPRTVTGSLSSREPTLTELANSLRPTGSVTLATHEAVVRALGQLQAQFLAQAGPIIGHRTLAFAHAVAARSWFKLLLRRPEAHGSREEGGWPGAAMGRGPWHGQPMCPLTWAQVLLMAGLQLDGPSEEAEPMAAKAKQWLRSLRRVGHRPRVDDVLRWFVVCVYRPREA